eukprot:3711370-Pleurochrysis_carterae.AAC.1
MWSNLASSVSALLKRNIPNKFYASFSSSSEAAATCEAAQRGVGGNSPAAGNGKSDERHESPFSSPSSAEIGGLYGATGRSTAERMQTDADARSA